MTARTFRRGGASIPHRKSATEGKPIVVLPAPEEVVIPLCQHLGAPCQPAVKVGEQIKMGQRIGESKQFICAPVHSSVSGVVVALEERPLLDGSKTLSAVIKNDGLDQPSRLDTPGDFRKMSPASIRKIVKKAGIVGMGGAGFPTHVKLNPPSAVEAVLINGAECEPYLTCDHRLMIERGEELVGGLLAMIKAARAERGIICIESNKGDAIEIVGQRIVDYPLLSLAVLQTRYPQGAEKQLIKAVLNKEVPSGSLPCEVGCVVNNVHTAIAVYEALSCGKASYERVVTVSGGAVVDPRNVLVRVGTPIQSLFDFCGGFLGKPAALVAGGPMTGSPIVNPAGPVVKSSSGFLALSADETAGDRNRPCIRCSLCVQACPMGLVPSLLGEYSANGLTGKTEELRIRDCIECALCAYVCPSKRALFSWIKEGKAALEAAKAKQRVS